MVIGNTHQNTTTIDKMQHHAATTGNTQQHATTTGVTQQNYEILDVDQRRLNTAVQTAALANLALANERCRLGKATATAMSAKRSLAKERCCLEMAKATAISAEQSLAKERLHHETATQTAVLMATALTEERCRLETATAASTSVRRSLANERHRHENAARTAESMELVLAEERCRLETTTALTAPVDGALRLIHAAYATLAAPLDAQLANIASIEHIAINHIATDIAYATPAPTPTSPSNTPATMSTVHQPGPSYLGAVLNTNRERHASAISTTMPHMHTAAARETLTAGITNTRLLTPSSSPFLPRQPSYASVVLPSIKESTQLLSPITPTLAAVTLHPRASSQSTFT